MTRLAFILVFGLVLSAPAFAQAVITLPIEEPAEEPQALEVPQEDVPEEDPLEPSEDAALGEDGFMEQFLESYSAPRIYDAEVDGPENLPLPIPDEDGISRMAVVRGLDKITARVRDVDAPVGIPVMFNSFEILVQTCYRRPPEETPETTAFIQITEHRLDGQRERIFSGWMYASTPSLNPVEHSTYDVWLIDCRTL